ncbi:MAG: hypothetical protein LUD77_10990, partial [Clostridiales bacterium]|nr:hypothetical protein [Clostridiales bacterium]
VKYNYESKNGWNYNSDKAELTNGLWASRKERNEAKRIRENEKDERRENMKENTRKFMGGSER